MTESGYSSGYSSDEFDCDQYFKSELVRFKRSFKVLSLMIKSANGTLYNVSISILTRYVDMYKVKYTSHVTCKCISRYM